MDGIKILKYAVVKLNVSDPQETIKMVKEVFELAKRHGYFDKHQAWTIIESVFRDGDSEFFLRRVRGKNEEFEHERSGEEGWRTYRKGEKGASNWQVIDEKRYSLRITNLSDREILVDAF